MAKRRVCENALCFVWPSYDRPRDDACFLLLAAMQVCRWEHRLKEVKLELFFVSL